MGLGPSCDNRWLYVAVYGEIITSVSVQGWSLDVNDLESVMRPGGMMLLARIYCRRKHVLLVFPLSESHYRSTLLCVTRSGFDTSFTSPDLWRENKNLFVIRNGRMLI